MDALLGAPTSKHPKRLGGRAMLLPSIPGRPAERPTLLISLLMCTFPNRNPTAEEVGARLLAFTPLQEQRLPALTRSGD